MAKKRSITKLTKEMTKEQFEKFCQDLAIDYSETDYEYARLFYCNKLNISSTCYYRCLEYAVINNLVDDVVVAGIMYKSAYNQNAYFKKKEEEKGIISDVKAGGTSLAKYNRLYEERCMLIANTFTDQEVDDIAEEFATKKRMSKYKLAQKYDVSTRVIDYILERACKDKRIDPLTSAEVMNRGRIIKKRKALKFKDA